MSWFPSLEKPILNKGNFGAITIPELLRVNVWVVVIPVAVLLTALLFWLEQLGY